jgi:hypothetical protein
VIWPRSDRPAKSVSAAKPSRLTAVSQLDADAPSSAAKKTSSLGASARSFSRSIASWSRSMPAPKPTPGVGGPPTAATRPS